jgi:hypothetical protein
MRSNQLAPEVAEGFDLTFTDVKASSHAEMNG